MDLILPVLFQHLRHASHQFRPRLLLLGLCIAPTLAAHVGSDYITIKEYTQKNPEQPALMARFSALVESPAKPVLQPLTRPVKIAAVYPGQQKSDYWHRNIQAFQLRLRKLNIDYRFDDYSLQSPTPLIQQQQAIDSALKNDPDYLILTLDDANQKRLIDPLLIRQRPKIILLNITTPLRSWATNKPLIYIGFDHILGSQMLADQLFQNSPKPPTSIGILYRQPGYVSRLRGGTFSDSMARHGAQLHSAYYTQGDSASAFDATLAMLSSESPPDFIYTCSTDLALGAIQALRQAGLDGTIGINGWGGGSAELEAIQQGDLALTVMRLNDDTGIAIAEAIRNDQQNKPVPQIYSGRMQIATPQQGAERIQRLSDTAFRYSGQ